MRNKSIVILLLSLFSFQLLPLNKVGAMLYSNQIQEEIPHNGTSEPGSAKFADDIKSLDGLPHSYQNAQPVFISIHELQTLNDRIHSRSQDDIPTPPPNKAS